jgi:hypothetical protein
MNVDRHVIGQEGTDSKCRILPEERLDEIDAMLEHSPRTCLRRIAQKTEVTVSKFQICPVCKKGASTR